MKFKAALRIFKVLTEKLLNIIQQFFSLHKPTLVCNTNASIHT